VRREYLPCAETESIVWDAQSNVRDIAPLQHTPVSIAAGSGDYLTSARPPSPHNLPCLIRC